MDEDLQEILTHILDSGRSIRVYVVASSRDDFLANRMTQDAVLWRFAVVGEACRRLQKRYPDCAARVSELREAIAYRNFLIHAYDLVDPGLVWGTIEASLPVLLAEIETELERLRTAGL
jgi:uncharacterized protein with HEPN domain